MSGPNDQVLKKLLAVFATEAEEHLSVMSSGLVSLEKQLPPEQRAVAHLKLWEGATFEEIAESLEISVNTAASRYRYALDKLRTRLRPIYEELQ